MVSDDDFSGKAKRLIELHLKLGKVKGTGQVRGETYLKYRANLGGRLSELRREHLELISDKMVKVEAGLLNIASISTSVMSQATYTSMCSSLECQKSSLRAERGKVESANDDEYVAILKAKVGQ